MEFSKERVVSEMATGGGTAAMIARAMYEKYGEEALAIMRDKFTEATLRTTPAKARKAGARIGNGTIEDWIRLEEWMARDFLNEFTVEFTPTRGVISITYCPMDSAIRKIFPDYCAKVLIGAERGFAATINPNLQVRGGCYMPQGAKSCDIICEWKPGTQPSE